MDHGAESVDSGRGPGLTDILSEVWPDSRGYSESPWADARRHRRLVPLLGLAPQPVQNLGHCVRIRDFGCRPEGDSGGDPLVVVRGQSDLHRAQSIRTRFNGADDQCEIAPGEAGS